MNIFSTTLLSRKNLACAALLSAFSTQGLAYDFVSVAQPFPTPPWNVVPEPLETIELQAQEDIRGDTIMLQIDPALAVGDRIVFTLTGGATFAVNALSLEEWLGGAGTGRLDYAVLQTAAPNGAKSIEFRMQDSGAFPVAGAVALMLSGSAIAGQAVNFNLPQVPGVDIGLRAEVFASGGGSKGSTTLVLFESTLAPVAPVAPTAAVSERQTRQAIANHIGQQMQRRAGFGPGLSGLLTGHGFGGQGISRVGGAFAPMLSQLEAHLFGGPAPLSVSLSGSGSEQYSGEFALSTNAYREWWQRTQAGPSTGTERSAGETLPERSDEALAARYNLWAKGRLSRSSDTRRSTDVKSDFGVVYLGVDARYRPGMRLGVMAELDWFDERAEGTGADGEGKGWMIGPYLVSRLAENLILDARGAYGRSRNETSPVGTYSDSYDTRRFLLETNLTGQWKVDSWEILPAVGIQYMEEEQQAYSDSQNQRIAAQTISLGNISFGPTVYYNLEQIDGSVIRPMLSVKGIWNFDAPALYNTNGQQVGGDDLRAQVKLGIEASMSGGTRWQGSYTYDGIGVSGLDVHGFELSVSTSWH